MLKSGVLWKAVFNLKDLSFESPYRVEYLQERFLFLLLACEDFKTAQFLVSSKNSWKLSEILKLIQFLRSIFNKFPISNKTTLCMKTPFIIEILLKVD